jgi:hypothetical protein
VPDSFRAADLTRAHLGRRLRVSGHEGILRDLIKIDDTHVQLLLGETGSSPIAPVVGQGAVVEWLDNPLDSPPG